MTKDLKQELQNDLKDLDKYLKSNKVYGYFIIVNNDDDYYCQYNYSTAPNILVGCAELSLFDLKQELAERLRGLQLSVDEHSKILEKKNKLN